MASLTELDISHNQIQEFSPALGMLSNLQKLALEKNSCYVLPPTLGLLSKLPYVIFSCRVRYLN